MITQDFFDSITCTDEYYAPASDDSPAYVIYTSGSTGSPKGVCHSVRGICVAAMRNINDMHKEYRGLRRLSTARFSFVAFHMEILTSLLLENTIFILPDEVKKSPKAMSEYIKANHIDIAIIPPQLLRVLELEGTGIKHIDTGSEAVSNIYFPGIDILNIYGQSETVLSAVYFHLDKAYENTPVGKPLIGLKVHILDEEQKEVADGERGELCIEGEYGVRYINDPEKSSKTFIKLENGNTLIHTGDTGYRNESGDIVYVSRKDWMVKVNGQRVETMEVEHKLNLINGISVSAVRAWIDSDGQNYIAGYYQKNGEITEDEIRQDLARSLPEYMIPRFLICMDELPKNANGKLDRTSLPEPEADGYKEEYTAPSTELERRLCDGFEAVLHCGRVGIYDDFIALGGDSIKVLLLLNNVNIENLTADKILLGKTPGGIAKLLKESGHESARISHMTDISEICPLTEAQIGIYMECADEPQSLKYNVSGEMKIPNDYDEERFIDAVRNVVNAHPAFFVKIDSIEGKPVMKVTKQDVVIETVQTDSVEEAKKLFIRPFDLANGPLFRFKICHINNERVFLFDMHHIICDGTSVSVFLRQVKSVYEGKKTEEEKLTVFDIAKAEENLTESEEYHLAQDFFSQRLKDAPPFGYPEPDRYGGEKGTASSIVSVRNDGFFETEELVEYTKNQGITYSTFFMGAFAYALAEFTGNLSCGFATVNSGRHDIRLRDSIGMFVKTLPITTEFIAEESVKDYLSRLQNAFYETISHDCISFGELAASYGVSNDVMFVYQSDMLNSAEMHDTGDAMNKITAMVFEEEKGFRLELHYMNSLYSEEIMSEFAGCMMNVVSEMLKKEHIGEIEPCSEKQLEKLDSFNPSQYPDCSSEETVVSLFRAAAEKYPDIIALVFKDKHYTYRQLDEITDVLAVYIAQAAGQAEKQPVVSILIPRNEYMAIIPIAAQKAGCCFQPLDPNYPPERLNFMVKDADASLVFADPSLADVLSDYSGKLILTSEISGILMSGNKASMPEPAKAEDPFILLYTSGSTGVPKGVILEQRNLAAYCAWYREYHRHAPGDALACYASFGFDVHMSEIYGSLTNGYTCHIIPEEIRLDLIALNLYFEENNIVGTFLTTAVGVQFAQSIDTTSLKVLTTAGEKLVSLEPPKDYQLINGYGPTETTITATTKKVCKKEENIPVGKPMSTVRCYVVDKNMHRLPIGASGELVIAGPQVARGYLNRPEKTAEVFIRDPFARETSEYLSRAYRTGDIVRWRQDGDIEYIGRRDGQVKIHGFRIELKEIEAVIREYPKVKDVTVQVLDGQGGEKYITAYVVSDDTVNADTLKQFIAGKKPAYMIPAEVVQLEKIPLNVNQKVDRKALPVPVLTPEENLSAPAADIPLNALETELKALVSEIVGTENFGLLDRFSHLGLSSISAIRLATLVYKKFGVSVKATELISGGTLRMLEDAILSAWMEEKKPAEKRIEKQEQTEVRKEVRAFCPLSFTQQGVYAECMASPDSTRYNIPYCICFPESIHAEELKEALVRVIAAHPSFSLRFTSNEKNETVQYYAPNAPEIPVKEMSGDAFAKYRSEFVRPFALTDEPPARFEIIQADRLYLLADVHHLLIDGTSMDIFLQQLCSCLDGEAPEKEAYTYFDHIADEKITPETEKFFEEHMADCEDSTRLIPDIFEEGLPHRERIVSVKTDLKAVSKFAAENGVTPAAVFLAAEYIASSRFVCEDRAAISTISNGRSDLRIHNTLGMFVNTLPLTVKIDNAEETLSFLKRVAEDYAATIEHENYPFARVAKKFDFHPSLSYTYQVGVWGKYSVRGAELTVDELSLDQAKLPCSVYIVGSVEDGGSIQVNYDEALYSESMMLAFAKSINNAVRGLMEKKTLSEISLTNEEQWQVLDSYNRPFDLNYDHFDTAVSLFRKQAAAHPDKTAAVYKDKEYTFSELDELTDRLAEIIYGELSAMTGLSSLAEQVVPIISSRSENAFILPLAVLKAGSAYEPLDPDYPGERLSFMVKDAGAKLLLAERGLEDHIKGFDGKLIFFDELYARLSDTPRCHVDEIPAPQPQDLLIMLYTSGTTGVPKGVQLIHENLVSFAHGSALDGMYTAESKTATYASFGFDVNMADTFCTLLNGGTVYLIPEEARMNLEVLAAYFDTAGITDVLLTTQVGVQFINSFPKLKTLRMLTVGGEKLPAINIDRLSYTVYNGYGPTENCAGVSIFPIRYWEKNIPIGRPFPSINAYVLDKTGHRLPAGAAGEYCLSGPQVGRGYLNRPEKTAEAFEDCPFNDFRMYHTGDIVRYRQNGDVEFVGRKDGQVKIRGFRVELKEIEAVIHEFEGIRDVTVQAYDFEGGGKYLAAFIVSDKKTDGKELSEFIRTRKPAYMVPAVIQQIDEIPLTVNRKVDKKALPKPEVQKGEYTAPQTKAEEDFCRIFGEILGIEKVGAEDDFFDLGGSSITAMKVVLAAGKAGYEIVYQDVFDNSTPRLLASLAEDSSPIAAATPNAASLDPSGSFYGPNTTEIGRDGYDYSKINALLRNNTLDAFRNGELRNVGDVLLTGPTGFLGIHVLRELINSSDRKIYCLVRSKNGVSGEERLKELLTHYFETDFSTLFGSRLFVIEGDATDADTLIDFAPKGEITVVNCAANVAHFAKGDSIWRANVNSVENLISWCLAHKAHLVHVSTGSVSGASENGVPGDGFKLDEHILFAGQLVENNQYIHSKFMAERLIYEAILEKGLNAKVMRVSNLAPRFSDGMVQVNYKTNNS